MRLVTFGQDLLKILGVVTIIAKVSEPVVDLSVPGIAQIYNLSADEGAQLVTAFLQSESSAPAQASAAVTIAPAAVPAALPAPAIEAPADPAPAEVASPAAESEPQPGPGLHNVVPA